MPSLTVLRLKANTSITTKAYCFVVLLLIATLITACPPRRAIAPLIDATHPHGQASLTLKTTALLKNQPIDTIAPSARTTFRARPGRALPDGAIVVRQSDANPNVISSNVWDKIDPTRHPWIFVKVTHSPIAKQIGWQGWIHSDHLQPTTKSAGEPQLAGASNTLLSKPSPLCDRASLNEAACEHEIHPSLMLRRLGCKGDFVEVELWDPDGIYLSGFILRDHFSIDPCQIKPETAN